MKNDVYLALGSNLGDKHQNIAKAIEKISDNIGDVVAVSSVYETEPEGFMSENIFANAACRVSTGLSLRDVWQKTREIEQMMGRKNKSRNGEYSDRIIDIDILMYNADVVHSEELTVPHACMHERKFVLDPLSEIAADVVHPRLKKTIRQLKEALSRFTK